MSCSSKRNNDVGSCMSTLVSSTKIFVTAVFCADALLFPGLGAKSFSSIGSYATCASKAKNPLGAKMLKEGFSNAVGSNRGCQSWVCRVLLKSLCHAFSDAQYGCGKRIVCTLALPTLSSSIVIIFFETTIRHACHFCPHFDARADRHSISC